MAEHKKYKWGETVDSAIYEQAEEYASLRESHPFLPENALIGSVIVGQLTKTDEMKGDLDAWFKKTKERLLGLNTGGYSILEEDVTRLFKNTEFLSFIEKVQKFS